MRIALSYHIRRATEDAGALLLFDLRKHMSVPAQPKIYHIVHVDRLSSILESTCLLSDASVTRLQLAGSNIGMQKVKQRRLYELTIPSYPNLHVGDCVPFYFCPRSVMLYVISRKNHIGLAYKDGQEPIIHLRADLYETIHWAEKNAKRWVFTLSNAGARYFEDRNDLANLCDLDWEAINATNWKNLKEGKQAEFLIEDCFPFDLVEMIGVHNNQVKNSVESILKSTPYTPTVKICPEWYY